MNPIEDAFSRTLESYTRIIDATALDWLGTLAYFSGLADLQVETDCPDRTVGFIAHISSSLGSVSCIQSDCPARIRGTNGANISLLVYRQNPDAITSPDSSSLSAANWVNFIGPHQTLHIQTSASLEALLVQFESDVLSLDALTSELGTDQQEQVAAELNRYLISACFTPDHAAFLEDTERCLSTLCAILNGGYEEHYCDDSRPIDHRVLRAVACIRDMPEEWDYSIKDLATWALTSERHLYNLMKRHIGQTPYRFYVRSRLLRVRNELIRSSSDSPGVSWHALSHGFNHLGRFPSLYKEQFGELPSETLAWRRSITEYCDAFRACIREP